MCLHDIPVVVEVVLFRHMCAFETNSRNLGEIVNPEGFLARGPAGIPYGVPRRAAAAALIEVLSDAHFVVSKAS